MVEKVRFSTIKKVSSAFSDKFLRFPPENEKGTGNDHQNNNAPHDSNAIRLGMIGLHFFQAGCVDQIAMRGRQGMRRGNPQRVGKPGRSGRAPGCVQQEEKQNGQQRQNFAV
jgi:hypothetical protein